MEKTGEKKSPKVNLNFKVEKDLKSLLDQLVVLKTIKDNQRSSQQAVLEEALVVLLKHYNEEYGRK